MPFVKLDTGILTSTLWVERECREIFITALLMAEPYETLVPLKQIAVRTLDLTGWEVPPGWYGFVRAAGVGIIRMAIMEQELGLAALERLASPDPQSRSGEFDGRRLVRVDGGYIVLNYIKYRERDYGAAERMRRLRQRRMTPPSDGVTPNRCDVPPNVTQAEAEAEAEKINNTGVIEPTFTTFWTAYPRKTAKQTALKAWKRVKHDEIPALMAALEAHKQTDQWRRGVIPHPATWLHQRRWEDETILPQNLGQCMWNIHGDRAPNLPRCGAPGEIEHDKVVYCKDHKHLHGQRMR